MNFRRPIFSESIYTLLKNVVVTNYYPNRSDFQRRWVEPSKFENYEPNSDNIFEKVRISPVVAALPKSLGVFLSTPSILKLPNCDERLGKDIRNFPQKSLPLRWGRARPVKYELFGMANLKSIQKRIGACLLKASLI
jgi:hypothetical protein